MKVKDHWCRWGAKAGWLWCCWSKCPHRRTCWFHVLLFANFKLWDLDWGQLKMTASVTPLVAFNGNRLLQTVCVLLTLGNLIKSVPFLLVVTDKSDVLPECRSSEETSVLVATWTKILAFLTFLSDSWNNNTNVTFNVCEQSFPRSNYITVWLWFEGNRLKWSLWDALMSDLFDNKNNMMWVKTACWV